jgi:hypothetical protein
LVEIDNEEGPRATTFSDGNPAMERHLSQLLNGIDWRARKNNKWKVVNRIKAVCARAESSAGETGSQIHGVEKKSLVLIPISLEGNRRQ